MTFSARNLASDRPQTAETIERGFVRDFGRQMFATFGTTLAAPTAAMFVRIGTTYRS